MAFSWFTNAISLWFMVVVIIVRWGYKPTYITFGGPTLWIYQEFNQSICQRFFVQRGWPSCFWDRERHYPATMRLFFAIVHMFSWVNICILIIYKEGPLDRFMILPTYHYTHCGLDIDSLSGGPALYHWASIPYIDMWNSQHVLSCLRSGPSWKKGVFPTIRVPQQLDDI